MRTGAGRAGWACVVWTAMLAKKFVVGACETPGVGIGAATRAGDVCTLDAGGRHFVINLTRAARCTGHASIFKDIGLLARWAGRTIIGRTGDGACEDTS